jgi:hypothetical protein
MGYSSVDDLFNSISVDGKILRVPFTKEVKTGATSAAGRWHELLSGVGTGGSMVLTGTPGTGLVKDASSAGALPIGANVETAETRHLLSMMVNSAATTLAPANLILTDIIHVYPSCVLVTTPSTLSNHPTWTGTGDTRMTNAKGVQASVFLTTASTAAGQLTLTYTDQDSNSQAQSGSLFGPVAATPIGACLNQTPVTATPGALNMAMAVGDYGVRQVNSYAINTGVTTGVGCIILHRPIASIPIILANTPAERDFTTGIITLPRIYDNACLGMFVQIGGALTTGNNITGEIVMGWS